MSRLAGIAKDKVFEDFMAACLPLVGARAL